VVVQLTVKEYAGESAFLMKPHREDCVREDCGC